jgi:hypothetical protein
VKNRLKKKPKGFMVALRETLKQLEIRNEPSPLQAMLAKDAEKPFLARIGFLKLNGTGFVRSPMLRSLLALKVVTRKSLNKTFLNLNSLSIWAWSCSDGEIVVMKNGKPDFQALLERGQAVSQGRLKGRCSARQRFTSFLMCWKRTAKV